MSLLNGNCIFDAIKNFYLNNEKQLKIGHCNINSVRNKFIPIREALQENVLDILSIQESKIDESFPNAQFEVENYILHRKDCKASEGGLMLYVRNDMPQFRRSDLESFSFNDSKGRIELLVIEMTIYKEKWLFVCLYKQPKVKLNLLIETVDRIMCCLATENYNIVLVGDFNVNMFKPNDFSDFIALNGMKNLVKEATCFKGTPSLIDLIITNKPKRFTTAICADIEISDFHSMICVATKAHVPKLQPRTFKYRSYRNFDNDAFLNELSLIPYHVIDVFDEIDDSYWIWHELTLQIVNEHAPIKNKTIKAHGVPYMNGELRRNINIKNMLKRRYERFKNKTNYL